MKYIYIFLDKHYFIAHKKHHKSLGLQQSDNQLITAVYKKSCLVGF